MFSIPGELADIALHNKAIMHDWLFRAASETMLTIAADPRHLGARIGVTAVLHTWGSALTHHPHIHMIVPGSGISLHGTRGWQTVGTAIPGSRMRTAPLTPSTAQSSNPHKSQTHTAVCLRRLCMPNGVRNSSRLRTGSFR